MGATTGILPIGTYTLNDTLNLALLYALLPNTDIAPAQAAGGFLDEMSPAAVAQLRVEFETILGEIPLASGFHVATAGEATANEITVDTGVITDEAFGSIVHDIVRTGASVSSDEIVTDNDDGTFTITEDSTYNVTAGDIIVWYVA
jgi:hypothetical protein